VRPPLRCPVKNTVKLLTVLDNKSTKSFGHFEENQSSLSSHQLLLEKLSKID
jgi:hypothetical protein